MAEFGKEKRNCGGNAVLAHGRLEPAYSAFKKYFPDSQFIIYTDNKEYINGYAKDVILQEVSPIFKKERKRWGWECNDFYKVLGLYDITSSTKEAVAIAIDSDLVPVSEEVKLLPSIIEKFELTAPLNPRYITRLDNHIGGGGKAQLDFDLGIVTNSVPLGALGYCMKNIKFFYTCLNIIRQCPTRLPVVMAKAAWDTGIYPYVLPPQWCVCSEHAALPYKIILHVGHNNIYDLYKKSLSSN
jgi:hypothetical protein